MNRHARLLIPMLLLSACSSPIPVSVKDSPFVLRGQWGGKFAVGTSDQPPAEDVPRTVLEMNLNTAYQNRDQYHFEGTAQWGAEKWTVSGTGSGTLIEFKQATPSELRAEGIFKDLQGNKVTDFQCGRAMLYPGTHQDEVWYTCWITLGGTQHVGYLTKAPLPENTRQP